ncbi:MAG TPA: hypothetical protein VMF06_20270 [Candidatus Limnocylindria bacterium]|nr:hypothetical protein [Candidatus Limnocylindria bacterium]
MKNLPLLAALGCLGVLAPCAQALTYVSADEIFLTADVDGDGRDDAIIVDRTSGAYRIGYQLAADVYTWANPRASGVQDVTAVAKGRILTTTRDTLAFTGPTGNRVTVLDAPDPLGVVEPFTLFPIGFGPNTIASVNITLPPVTANDDLVATTLESFSTSFETVFRASGGTNIVTQTSLSSGRWIASDRIQLKQGGLDFVGATVLGSTNTQFGAWQYGPAAITKVAGDTATVLSRFVFGRFGAALQNQFVFFDLGGSNIVYRAVQELTPNVFTFNAGATFPLGASIDSFYVLPGTPVRLMAVVNQGAEARIYDFDGASNPILRQTIAAPSGESLTGAIPLASGKLNLLSGLPGSGRSSNFRHYSSSGGNYVQDGAGSLPSINALGMNANVFLFQADPFVNPGSTLVKQLNAADWSDSVSFAGGKVTVQAERLGTASAGLGNPGPRDLGTKPAAANFGLVNQYHPLISVTSLDPAFGVPTTDIQISPHGGFQAKAVQIQISTAVPGYIIAYSVNGGSWNLYTGPFWIYKNSSIRYLGELPGGATKTDVHIASYTFGPAPAVADSDGDGVPDYVEIAMGLDPTRGSDTDGDGFTDLNEILKGTDPNDKTSTPTNAQRLENFQSFDIQMVPRPFDGTTLALTTSALGVAGSVHTLDSSLLRSSLTAVVSGAPVNPINTFTNVRAELRPPLVALATEANFDISTPSTDKTIGREMLGLLSTPQVFRPAVNYVQGSGTPAVEAANWIAAAQAAYAGTSRIVVNSTVGINGTLAALLFERKVNEIFMDRAVSGFNDTNLTLFGFRFGDSGRRSPTLAQLDVLSRADSDGHPAYNLPLMLGSVYNEATGSPALDKLRLLVKDIYRISSLSNNMAPGYYPLPVDVIRQFLISGIIQSNYAAVSTLLPSEVATAHGSVGTLLAGLSPRPTAGFDLAVVADSFQPGCTHLQDMNDGTSKTLFAALGIPYVFPETFTIVPGSIVHVTAYTDYVDTTGCPGTSLQVIAATLISSPNPPIIAGNNDDLISDAWANFFFGGPVNPYGDDDNDGFSNLQEFLDGTDPKNLLSHSGHAFSLLPPLLQLLPAVQEGGPFKLSFDFPVGYSSLFNFDVEQTLSLDGAFTPLPQALLHGAGDHLEVDLPAVQDPASFFRVVMTVK